MSYPWLTIDGDSAVPPSEQLRTLIAGAAATGKIPVGSRLPPIRLLAENLGLAANTVAKAYRELEHAGIVQTRSRAGTVVSGSGGSAHARAGEAATVFAGVVKEQGLTADDAAALARAAFNRLT